MSLRSFSVSIGAFLRRAFGAVKPILFDIGRDAVPVVLAEWRAGELRTDQDRREAAERVVVELIQKKYPAYAWLVPAAVDLVFDTARDVARRRGNK